MQQSCHDKAEGGGGGGGGGQSRKSTAFQVNVASFPKVVLSAQYWQNNNSQVREKLVILSCNILKTAKRRNFKPNENIFWTFLYHFVSVKN